jgi:hypothetical protein
MQAEFRSHFSREKVRLIGQEMQYLRRRTTYSSKSLNLTNRLVLEENS